MTYGKLYLIPSPLGDNEPVEVIPGPVLEKIRTIRTFVVEETRTARRFLSLATSKDICSCSTMATMSDLYPRQDCLL